MLLHELLAANARYRETFSLAGLEAAPQKHLAVLTCMDARIDPLAVLGLRVGDAHIVRTAGGRAGDALRSLAVSELLGVDTLVVLQHTRCGLLGETDASLTHRLRTLLDADVAVPFAFLPFAEVRATVAEDVAWLRASPLLGHLRTIAGAVYDVDTGCVEPVVGFPDADPPSPAAPTAGG